MGGRCAGSSGSSRVARALPVGCELNNQVGPHLLHLLDDHVWARRLEDQMELALGQLQVVDEPDPDGPEA